MQNNVIDYGDCGVCTDDLSLKIITIADNKQVYLKDNEVFNPFYIGLNNDNQLDLIDEKQLYSTYKRVLIMCMHSLYNSEEEARKIFNIILAKDDFLQLSKYFTLLVCTRKVLYSDMQYRRALRVSKQYLEYFNHNNILLEVDEIVIPLFELKEDMARLYISLYDVSSNVNEISKLISLNSYYNLEYQNRTQKQLSQIINNIKESDYWTNPYNCRISFGQQFIERSFQWKDVSTNKIKDNKDVINIIDKIKRDNNYDLTHVYKPDSYVDLSTSLRLQEKRTYYATVDNNDLNITKDEVTNLFNSIEQTNEKILYDLFNAFLISKEFCHMVLNNYSVLKKMGPIINKYIVLYKYLFGYAWNSFYAEECLFKTKTVKNNRYVFDINTANLLPYFPICSGDINQNPYITFLVSNKETDIENNCMSLYTFMEHDGYGIDTLERFRWKFNIFTTGDVNKNIFDGLNWKNGNNDHYAISGSIIPAFLSIKSPLFDLVVNKLDTEDKQWLTYFNHYYKTSDIDFMCNDESVFDFMDSIYHVKGIVEKNIGDSVRVEPIKSTSIIVHSQYLIEKINDIREYIKHPEITVEQVLDNINTNEIKEYFYRIYTTNKQKDNILYREQYKHKSNPLYEDYFKMSSIEDINIIIVTYEINKDSTVAKDCETCFYVNDIRNQDKVSDNILLLKLSENIKFKFKSDKMFHSIEAFRVKSGDFFTVVGRFHLPCVRGYYNGDNVYLMSSCVTANMTGINIDYKYFAGIRDPIDILNKYRIRGFGTILNANEKQHMVIYNRNVEKMNKIFNLNSKDSIKEFYGFKHINNAMFKEPLYNYNNLDYKSIITIDDLKTYYKTKYNYDVEKIGIDMFKLKTINGDDGTINPLNKWISNAFYDLVNKK